MQKQQYYKDFSETEINNGYLFMQAELLNSDATILLLHDLFVLAWADFLNGTFSFDGASFVKERSINTIFEVPAFIHDWRNSKGYVGLKIDDEMFSIMAYLNYAPHHFIVRSRWTFFTWINILRHKYYLKDLKTALPKDLLIIK